MNLSMTLAIALVVIAAICLIAILRLAVSRNLQISKQTSLAGQISPIDIEAFRNLANPSEDEFLRQRLPGGEFRRVRRVRLRAMCSYIQLAGRNAAVLIEIGQAALASNNASTAEAASQLVDQALLLRRNAIFALLRIQLALVWPTAGLAAVPVLRGYENLNGSAMLLSRLQNPAAPVRFAAIF
jgi:hypothetical protein